VSQPPRKRFGGPFSDALFDAIAKTATTDLSRVELRILTLASKLIHDAAMQQRFNVMALAPPGEAPKLPVLTPEMFADAVLSAVRAAIEIEKPLRDMRDALSEEPQA